MTTKTAVASFDSPRRNYFFPSDFMDREELISDNQKNTLATLIYQNILDKEKRESYLNQIHDITRSEASDWIMEFEMGMWR